MVAMFFVGIETVFNTEIVGRPTHMICSYTKFYTHLH